MGEDDLMRDLEEKALRHSALKRNIRDMATAGGKSGIIERIALFCDVLRDEILEEKQKPAFLLQAAKLMLHHFVTGSLPPVEKKRPSN